jgi:hypothetical protein
LKGRSTCVALLFARPTAARRGGVEACSGRGELAVMPDDDPAGVAARTLEQRMPLRRRRDGPPGASAAR